MYSVKKVYLTNQEEICHETNFHAFYTPQGVNISWNHLQRYSYQEDMNFTNRRFSNPSICEYLSLEVVSSPKKKRSDPNQSMDFNMDLLSLQQAKNEEKSPQKYGVMAHFPKPVKPVLHLPYLESQAFKLQQLYSFQFMDEISTYQAPRKVPRKLSYPLKPSRFKIIQAPPFQAKSPQSLQRLVSDFVSLEICFLSFYFMNVLSRSF
ncbi:hypothetical protein DY000_02021735 [Brassica cretica]|uniref:TPX2 central domain-containing protein n=1 Tax=Brassica cretica TaxID=69181 RepID=A0ABQ7EHV1_BRACR|nr:hypothetical protein DY000_02021735 [Brassica cretica]